MKLLHGTTFTVPCGGICPELIIVILVAETRDTACYSLLFVNLWRLLLTCLLFYTNVIYALLSFFFLPDSLVARLVDKKNNIINSRIVVCVCLF